MCPVRSVTYVSGRSKGLERKTKFSLLLWDRCGTFYPPFLAISMALKDLACKTKSSFLCCGTAWEFFPHARIGAPRSVIASACRCGRQSGSPAPRGDPHPDLHNDRPLNDWHGRAVLPDLPPKRLLSVTAPRTARSARHQCLQTPIPAATLEHRHWDGVITPSQ